MSASVTGRTDFLDRIRVSLTALVILHHTSIMYGGDGGWYLRFPHDDKLSKVLLTMLCATDQSFFMGMFFLLAGYFTPLSLMRKGIAGFIRDRLIRLGIPLLIFTLLLGPFTIALADTRGSSEVWQRWGQLIADGVINPGPLWFAFALLIFSAVYLLIHPVIRGLGKTCNEQSLTHRNLLAVIAVWGCGAFLLRLWVPTGQEIAYLQIGFFSSYILLFFGGCAAAEHRLLEKITPALARPWLVISLLTIPTLMIYAVASGALRGVKFDVHGGWTLPALFYAYWEAFVGTGIMLTLLWRTRVAKAPSALWKVMAPQCFGAFIVHAPVVVAVGLCIQPLQLHPLAMFALAGSASVVISFNLAAVLRQIPLIRRVI